MVGEAEVKGGKKSEEQNQGWGEGRKQGNGRSHWEQEQEERREIGDNLGRSTTEQRRTLVAPQSAN